MRQRGSAIFHKLGAEARLWQNELPNYFRIGLLLLIWWRSRPADQRQARKRTKKKRREGERERERVSFNITIYADLASNYIMFKFPAGEDWRVRNQDQKPQIKLDFHWSFTNDQWALLLAMGRFSPSMSSQQPWPGRKTWKILLTAAFSRHKNTKLPFQERLLRLL